MLVDRVHSLLFEWEPHPDIDSEAAFRQFHREVSCWNRLQRQGLWPPLVVFGFAVLVVAPGLVLSYGYGVTHPLATGPLLAVTFVNTVMTFVGLFFLDRRFPVVMADIVDGFDVDPARYFGFLGRLFETLYHYSMFAPVFAGPHGRTQRPAFWAGLVGCYLFWLGAVAAFVPVSLPAAVGARVLLVVYYLCLVAWAAFTLYSSLLFVAITTVYLAARLPAFPIALTIMERQSHFGLEPFGVFLFQTLFIGMVMLGVGGLAGLLSNNPLLLIFTLVGTPLVVVWFVAEQYGIHRSILRTKQKRLQQLGQAHVEDLDSVFLESGPDPTPTSVERSDALISVKNEIRSLPNWPTTTTTVYRAIFALVVSNLPSLVGLFL